MTITQPTERHQAHSSLVIRWNEQAPYKTALEALQRFKWSVFPLDDTKRPPVIPGKFTPKGDPMRLSWKRYQDQLATPYLMQKWQTEFNPTAWAIITGSLSDRIILDFDGESANKLLESWNLSPHVRTGRGGHHVYFQHPGWNVKTLNSEASKELGRRWPGLDTRGDGGYAVFTGSSEFGTYTWLRDPEPDSLDLLPDDLRDFLGLLYDPEDEEAKAYARERLAKHIVNKYLGESQSGRDNACFAMACQLRDNKFTQAEAEKFAYDFAERVHTTDTQGHHDPFTSGDARAKVASAYKKPARKSWDENKENGHKPAGESSQKRFHLTDLGNAERFASHHKHHARWCKQWNCWMVFNGQCWEQDKTDLVDRLAKTTVRSIYGEAREEADTEERKLISKHAMLSESSRAIRAMLDRAKSELPVTPDQFNKHLHLFNFKNGTLDLRTGELREHNASDMLTRCVAVNYNPLARAPLFIPFLNTIFNDDQALIQYVIMALGMSLAGDIREQCWFLCHGDGNNGKSTLLELIRAILGEYAIGANIESFLARKDDRTYDRAEFYGARFITASEIPPKSRLNEAFLKKITGGEDLRAARKFENEFQFTPECTIWLSVNHLPTVKDTSKGMWRRVRYIPFNVTIPDNQIDTDLPKKLLQEAEGILAILVEGCKAWYGQGRLITPTIVIEATKKYQADQDTISRFLMEECEIRSGQKTLTRDLNTRYEWWCEEKQERPDPAALKETLNRRGIMSKRSTGGKYAYVGIELKPKDAAPLDDEPKKETPAQRLLAEMARQGCDLKIRSEDGEWIIGVPETWTDEQFEALRVRVIALDTELRQLLAK